MAIRVTEAPTSRATTSGADPTHERIYNIAGTTSESQARDLGWAYAPATYLVGPVPLVKDRARAVPTGKEHWKTTVHFQKFKGRPEVGDDPRTAFTIAMSATTITHAISTVTVTPAPGVQLPDFKGSIGVGADGRVAGCTIQTPIISYSETWIFAQENVTLGYQKILERLAGKVNHLFWNGREQSDVLFLGCRGAPRDEESWRLDFNFGVSPTELNMRFGPITVPRKRGFEYLWIYYKEAVSDGPMPVIIPVPLGAIVNQIYIAADFTQIGIG